MPAVALLGSRQVGKTTLARGLEIGKVAHCLDLERPSDLAKLTDPELYLSGFSARLTGCCWRHFPATACVCSIRRWKEPETLKIYDSDRPAEEKACELLGIQPGE